MYAWFHDAAVAQEFARYLDDLPRGVHPAQAEALATTSALALGGVILYHPQQRFDAGYAVAIDPPKTAVIVRPGRPWWKRVLWHVGWSLVVLAVYVALSALLWAIEVMPW